MWIRGRIGRTEETAPTEAASPVADESATAQAFDKSAEVTVESLRGIWANDGSSSGYWATVLVRFDTDGGFAIGNTGRVDGGAYHVGSYEVMDGTVALTIDDPKDCSGSEVVWAVDMDTDGTMMSEVVDSNSCVAIGTVDGWIRVSPASPAGRALGPGTRDTERRAPEQPVDVFGIWLRVGTGEVLQIWLDGTFAFDQTGDLHGNPSVTGTFVVDGANGTIEFTSSGSEACEAGAAWKWSETTIADDLVVAGRPRGTTMRAQGPDGSCGSENSQELTWRLLSRGGR